ncbi:MAG: hypothetical protein P1P86_00825 [Bacteroidales bacterium]|nr:hypothetical protein [Bacteroidales bacterium]
MKKRNIVIAAVAFTAMGILPACDIIEECGTCELVTEDAQGNKSYGTPLPFCGDDLTDKKNAPPVTINGVTTYWNCD